MTLQVLMDSLSVKGILDPSISVDAVTTTHKELTMKLTAFAATTSSQSINRQLVDYALTLVPDDTEIQVLDSE